MRKFLVAAAVLTALGLCAAGTSLRAQQAPCNPAVQKCT